MTRRSTAGDDLRADADPTWTGTATWSTPTFTIESMTGAMRGVSVTRHGLAEVLAPGSRWTMGVGGGRAMTMEVVRSTDGGTEVSVTVGSPFDCDASDVRWSPL